MPKYLVEMHDGRKFQVEADSPPSEADVLTHMGGGAPKEPYVPDSPLAHHLNEQEGGGDWGQNLADAGQPFAHPQTAGDIAGLLIPSGGAEAIGKVLRPVGQAISKYGGAAAKLAGTAATTMLPPAIVAPARAALQTLGELKPSEWNSPLTVAGREGRAAVAARAFNDQPLAQQMSRLPTTGPIPEGRAGGQAPPIRNLGDEAPAPSRLSPVARAAAPAAPTGLSETDKALLAKKYPGLDPAKVEQQMSGRLQMAPTDRPPITVSPESPMQPPSESPMQQPRVQVGAEVVGRQQGLSKEAVRAQTAPILGEQPGQASPIFPEQTLGKIVDTLKQMPPGSAEREAYVARATSGKAQWQIENIRRTLEHLGLIVPVAVAAPSVRDLVMQRLRGEQ